MRLCLCIPLFALLSGCGTSEHIEGSVKDVFGRPLEGVLVSIDKSAFTAQTKSDGTFKLDYVPGQFIVRYKKSGYTTHTIELSLHQKARFPVTETVLYPIPPKPGLYLVDRSKAQLVEVPHNSVAISTEQSSGFMESIHTFRARPYDSSEGAPFIVSLGPQEFVDSDPDSFKLYHVRKEDNVFSQFKYGPFGKRDTFSQLPKESMERVGEEKLLLRKFEKLSQGTYVWASSDTTIMGIEVPRKDAKARIMIANP